MTARLAHIQRYLSYRWRSVTRHGVHSPFVYNLIEDVLRDKKPVHAPDLKEKQAELLSSEHQIEVLDLGAGSTAGLTDIRKIKDIARHSQSSSAQCEILFKLVRYLKVKSVLEFGSCLGLSAAYMTRAGAKVVSMEGSPALHRLATDCFGEVIGPDFRLGAFDDLLPEVLSEMPSIDMVFIDGNHTYEASLRYFHSLLPTSHDKSVMVFDDIHWSAEMEDAWNEIIQHPQVTCSIDIFWCGMVFFDPGLSGEHFTIRY